MKRALLDGLTAPLRYKLLGLAVALVLGFVLTAGAVLMQLVEQVGFLAACVFGIVMGVFGLMVAGSLVRRRKAG